MMKLINSKLFSHASGMSILALLVISAALMICALPSAHAQVTGVQKEPYEPEDAVKINFDAKTFCEYELDGTFKNHLRNRTACTKIPIFRLSENKCIRFCEKLGPNWIFEPLKYESSCVCNLHAALV